MRASRVAPLCRPLAALLGLCLMPPAPVLALRPPNAGMEENPTKGQLRRELTGGAAREVPVPPEAFARLLDHVNLAGPADVSKREIQRTVREAIETGAASVAVRPGRPALWAAEEVSTHSAPVKVEPVIGIRLLRERFHRGLVTPADALALYDVSLAEKRREITQTLRALREGFPHVGLEISFVLNLKKLAEELNQGKEIRYVKDEIRKLIEHVRSLQEPGEHLTVKVIGENYWLGHLEKRSRNMNLMVLIYGWAKEFGADFVKSASGFTPEVAEGLEIQRMRQIVGAAVGIEAAGGVRTAEDAVAVMRAMGTAELNPSTFRIGTAAAAELARVYREAWEEDGTRPIPEEWSDLLGQALRRWQEKGWLSGSEFLGAALVGAKDDLNRRLPEPGENLWPRRLAALEGLRFLIEATGEPDPARSQVRLISYSGAKGPFPKAVVELETPKGEFRFLLSFRNDSNPRVIIGVKHAGSPEAKLKWAGAARIGADMDDGSFLHLDLADSDSPESETWIHRIPLNGSWSSSGDAQEAVRAFRHFQDEFFQYLRNVPPKSADPSAPLGAGLEEESAEELLAAIEKGETVDVSVRQAFELLMLHLQKWPRFQHRHSWLYPVKADQRGKQWIASFIGEWVPKEYYIAEGKPRENLRPKEDAIYTTSYVPSTDQLAETMYFSDPLEAVQMFSLMHQGEMGERLHQLWGHRYRIRMSARDEVLSLERYPTKYPPFPILYRLSGSLTIQRESAPSRIPLAVNPGELLLVEDAGASSPNIWRDLYRFVQEPTVGVQFSPMGGFFLEEAVKPTEHVKEGQSIWIRPRETVQGTPAPIAEVRPAQRNIDGTVSVSWDGSTAMFEFSKDAGPFVVWRLAPAAGLEERTPGKDPADPDAEVRAGAVRQVMETRSLSPGSAVVLARFLAGEMDFDQGREELLSASWQNPPGLDSDQARQILLQLWILARHRLDYALSEDLVEAVGNRVAWTTAWFNFLSRTPGLTSIDQARPILDDIRRLADLAGIAQMDPMAQQFSGLVKRVRHGITQEDWGAVTRALVPQPEFSPAMNLGVFALLAAPGKERLEPAQLYVLASAVIWSLDQRLAFGVDPLPIDVKLLVPALRSVLMDVLTEPVPEEVAEAALLGGESNIGIANLAAVGATVLAEALYRAVPADESSELTQAYLPVAARLQQLAWYFAREPYREGTSLKQLWMQSEMELYFSKPLPEGEAIAELSRIALGRRFSRLVFEDEREQVATEFTLPMDPTDAEQTVAENVRRLTAESNVEPRGVSLLAVLAAGGPPILVVSPNRMPEEEKEPEEKGEGEAEMPVAVQATLIPPAVKNPFPVAEPEGPPAQQREVFVTDFLKVYYRSVEAAEQTIGALLRALDGPERLPGFERQDVDLIPLQAEQDPEPYSILVRTADEILPAELEQRWRENHVALITVSPEMTLAQLIREALAQWTGRPVGEILEIRRRDELVGIFA